jgi:hypothetical protein
MEVASELGRNRSHLLRIAARSIPGVGWIEPASRKRIGVPIALALALFATITSGEFRVSWAFLLVDALLVTAAALAGLVTLHRVRWSPSAQKRL